jgi:UPF0755 protein
MSKKKVGIYDYRLGFKEHELKSGFKKNLKFIFLFLLAIAGFLFYLYFGPYKNGLKANSNVSDLRSFSVKEGQNVRSVIDELSKLNYIKSSWALNWYVRLNGSPDIEHGEFEIDLGKTAPEILDMLNSKNSKSPDRMTIHSGKTTDQLKEVFYQFFKKEEVDSGLANLPKLDFLNEVNKPGVYFEGYIIPETYTDITDSTNFNDWLLRNFEILKERTSGFEEESKARGLTLHQAFTLASIIQMEASKDEDQKGAAAVYFNRLKQGGPLGADPGATYISKKMGLDYTDFNLDDAYNTRVANGLPPGPIATFDISTLKNVLEAPESEYLFFIAGDDGIANHCSLTCGLN